MSKISGHRIFLASFSALIVSVLFFSSCETSLEPLPPPATEPQPNEPSDDTNPIDPVEPSPPGDSDPEPPTPPPPPPPQKKDKPFGINTHIPSETMLEKVSQSGADWIRIDMNWYDIEPSKGRFQFSRFDAIIQSAKRRGLEVFATLSYTPKWANGGLGTNAPPKNASDWQNFIKTTVARYDGTKGLPEVRHWGIWNEPDEAKFFSGTTAQYINIVLKPGAEAVRAANPRALTVGPDLAWNVRFLEEVLVAAKDSIDIIAIHRYGVTAEKVMDAFDGKRYPWDKPNIVTILKQTGVFGKKPLWLSETGWPTTAPWSCWFDKGTVSESRQAELLRDLMHAMFVERDYFDKVFIYELYDADRTDACQWGILRSNLSEKPAFSVLREFFRNYRK